MDETDLIRAFAAGDEHPKAPARDAARQSLDDRIVRASSASPRTQSRARRRGVFTLTGGLAIAATAAILLLAVGGPSRSDSPAYGAVLVRFADSTPRLLLEQPNWKVRNVVQWEEGAGRMEFGPGSPDPPVAHISREDAMDRSMSSYRKVELSWGPVNNSARRFLTEPENQGFTKTMKVLDTVADVNPGQRGSVVEGPSGYRRMNAVWREGGQFLTLTAQVRDLAAFGERLRWLHRVDAETWLDAMPERVITAAQYGAEVSQMLRGVPLPPGFNPKRIPNRHLTTNRYTVGKSVGGAVACEWLRLGFEARAGHDRAAAREAEKVLLGSSRWPVFRRISKEGSYPRLVVEFAEAMPSGQWGHERPLRGIVNNGCAEIGFPILPLHATG